MLKKTESSIDTTVVAEPESKPKTKKSDTNWDTLARFGITQLVCQPLPGHPADEACKTRLIPTPQAIIDHLNAGHGGGFLVTLTDSGKSFDWGALARAGVECVWIRDEVNDKLMPINGRTIKAALSPHGGKFRGAWQAFHNQFLFNVSYEKAIPTEDDLGADSES